MTLDVRVIIPTISGREELLKRAVQSTRDHGDLDIGLWVEIDHDGQGPAATRNKALTDSLRFGEPAEFIAFLDDDDEFLPEHLPACVARARESGADVVYPWFDLMRGNVLRNDYKFIFHVGEDGDRVDAFERPFDPVALRRANYIPVTALVRTEKLVEVGGFPLPGSEEWPHQDCEDWGLWLRMLEAGAKFEHLPQRTWVYWHHGRNTSGRPENAKRMYQGGQE